jgi:hypothetical protein
MLIDSLDKVTGFRLPAKDVIIKRDDGKIRTLPALAAFLMTRYLKKRPRCTILVVHRGL